MPSANEGPQHQVEATAFQSPRSTLSPLMQDIRLAPGAPVPPVGLKGEDHPSELRLPFRQPVKKSYSIGSRKSTSSISLDDDGSAKSFPRRCYSCPATPLPQEERTLHARRSIAESNVQKLYEERKDKIMEIFENQWLISDELDEYD